MVTLTQIEAHRYVSIIRFGLLFEDVVKNLDDVDPEHVEAVELLAHIQEGDDQKRFVHFRHLHLLRKRYLFISFN